MNQRERNNLDRHITGDYGERQFRSGAEAQLIEPNGTLGLECTVRYAVEWCKAHPGWTWMEL